MMDEPDWDITEYYEFEDLSFELMKSLFEKIEENEWNTFDNDDSVIIV